MKKTISLLLAFLLIVCLAGCGNTAPILASAQGVRAVTLNSNQSKEVIASPAPSPSVPECGYAIDSEGFCITSGELFDALETILTDTESPFYSGVDVLIAEGQITKEIRSVLFRGIDTAYQVCTISADKDDFPGDDEQFTLITIIGDMSSDLNRLGMTTVSTAILYLTNKEAKEFQSAADLLLELVENDGKWVQKDAMEYQYSNLSGSLYGVLIREIAAYK